MGNAQRKHYPNVCRLCLKPPDPLLAKTVPVSKRDDLLHGTIKDYINSITGDASEEDLQFPQEVCLPCLETLRDHAKFRAKIVKCTLLLKAVTELKYFNNKAPVEELFQTEGPFLQELFEEQVSASDIINDPPGSAVSLDDLTLGQEIELAQDDEPSVVTQAEQVPKKRGRPRKEIKTFRCRQPNCTKEVFPDRKSYEHHRWTVHKGFICEECGQKCASKHGLDNHMARHRNEEEFQCVHCSRLYNVKKDLVYHIKQVHTARERFRCEECGLEYKYKSTLESHLLKHKEEFGFPCEKCDKKFKAKPLLNAHNYKIHSKQSYPCDECGKQFSNRFNLLDHIEVFHGIRMRFICDICVAVFDDRDQLDVHKSRHKSPTELECGTCLVVFNSKDQMFNHLCITYRNDYICCGKDHGHHRTYNRHMFVKHGTKVNVRVKPEPKALPGQIRAQKKRVETCSGCDQVFSTRLEKQRHVAKCGRDSTDDL